MIVTQTVFFAEHWRLVLCAAALGVALALAYVDAEHLIVPAWRLRTAHSREPGATEAFVTKERQQLRRLEDGAAVSSEHGRPEARETREEARLRRTVLGAIERRLGRESCV